MEVGNFRREAAGMNPPMIEDLDDNIEENDKTNPESQSATPMTKHRGSSKRKKDGGVSNGMEKSETIMNMNEHVKGTIDVWWLFDDGGNITTLFFLSAQPSVAILTDTFCRTYLGEEKF